MKKTEYSNKDELSYYLEDLKNLIKLIEHRRYLPDRYKDL